MNETTVASRRWPCTKDIVDVLPVPQSPCTAMVIGMGQRRMKSARPAA